MLAEHYGWTPKYESVTYNPYLEDYYKDIERWSYNLETYFLAQRFQDLLDIRKSNDVIIQDRTILEQTTRLWATFRNATSRPICSSSTS